MNHLENLRRRSGTGGRKSPDAITVKYTAHANDDDDDDRDIVTGNSTGTPGIRVSVPSKLTSNNNNIIVSSLPTVAAINPVAAAIDAIHNPDPVISQIVDEKLLQHGTLAEKVISVAPPEVFSVEETLPAVVVDVDDISNGFGNTVPGSGPDLDTLSVNSTTSGISTRESVTSHASSSGGGKRKWLSNLKQKIEHKFEKIEHKIEEKFDHLKSDKTGSSTSAGSSSFDKAAASTTSRGMSRSPSDLSVDSKKQQLGRIYENDDLNDADDVETDNVHLHATSSTLESERLLGNASLNAFSFASAIANKGRKAVSRLPSGESTPTESAVMPPTTKFFPKVDRNVIKVQTDLLQRCLNPADDYESDPDECPASGTSRLSSDGKRASAANSGTDSRKLSESRLSTTASSASLIQRAGLRSTSIAFDPTIRGRQGAKPPRSIQFETIVEGVQKKIKRERHFHAKEDPAEAKKRIRQQAKRSSKSKRRRGKDGVGETASDTNSADEAVASKDLLKGYRTGSRQSVTSLIKGHAMSRSLPSLVELPSSSDTEQPPASGADSAATPVAADAQSRTSVEDSADAPNGASRDAASATSNTDLLPTVDFQSTVQRLTANTPLEGVLDMWPVNLIMQHSSMWIYAGLLALFLASWFSSSSWNFLTGFFLGLLCSGVALYKLMKPLAAFMNANFAPTPPAPVMTTSQAVNFATDQIVQRRDNSVADKKVYEAWMLEFTGEYKAEDFVISDTRLIFIRVDGPILRIQRPKHEYLAPKIALDEKLPKAPTFVHQRIIDLDKSRVSLFPEKLSNSQRWNRKYPIVIVTQRMTSSKTVSKQRNAKDNVGKNSNNNKDDAATRVSSATTERKQEISSSASPKASNTQQRRASVTPSLVATQVEAAEANDLTAADGQPQDERILLFARTNRQKEQWYWLLRRAAKQDGPEMALIPDVRWFQSPNFTPLNALIHRMFADALSEKAWHDVVEFIIEDKLSKVALPTWIGDFKMSQLQLGKRIPLLSDVCDKPVYNEMGLWLDVWFEYHGGLTFRLETKLNLMELKRSQSPPSGRRSQSKNLATNNDESGNSNAGADLLSSYAAANAGGPTATSADSMLLQSPTSEQAFGPEFDESDPFSIDAEGNLCENIAGGANVDVYADASSNLPHSSSMPLSATYRKRFNSDAGGSSGVANKGELLSPMAGAAKAFDTASMVSTGTTGSGGNSKPNMTITTTTTSTSQSGAAAKVGTEGAAEMKRNKFLRFVDKIAQSKYFQSATENKYIKKAMEGVSNTPLTLQVELQRISGRLQINIPPPPSDKLWWGFAPTPHIDLNARPFYGEKEVKTTQVIGWLEKRLVSEINKLVTSPNFDDVTIPFMNNSIHTYEQRLSKLKDVFL